MPSDEVGDIHSLRLSVGGTLCRKGIGDLGYDHHHTGAGVFQFLLIDTLRLMEHLGTVNLQNTS